MKDCRKRESIERSHKHVFTITTVFFLLLFLLVQGVDGIHSSTTTTTTSVTHDHRDAHIILSSHREHKAGSYTPPWVKPPNFKPPIAWKGSSCYEGSVLHECPYPKLCFHNSTCIFWKTGMFLESSVLSSSIVPLGHHRAKNHSKSSNSLVRGMKTRLQQMCPKFDHGEFVRGKWKKSCAYPWLTSKELRSRVAGKHIAIIGDSMLRQLFMRFVWHARGFEEIIESYYHTDAFYIFNSTHDYLMIQAEYTPTLARSLIRNPIFSLSYTWDSDQKYLTKYPDADLRITFPTYWNVSVVDAKDSVKLLQVVNTPSFNTLYGTVPHRVPPAPENFSFAVEAANLWIKSQHKYYLPLEEMSLKKVFFRNEEDGTHFQCGMIHMWGEQASGEFKSPTSKDCRDMMNLNLVMMLVHYLNLL